MKIAGVEISHPNKIIFPKNGITKLEMIKYYDKISEKILPYLKDRPLTLHRFPNGVEEDGFYQKSISDYFPDYINTVEVKTEDGSNTQILCNNKKSLIYLVNQGTVAFHTWLSKKDMLYKPDKVVFDLDPSDNSFEQIKKAAEIVATYFRKKGKKPQVMTTGQRGLHVWYTLRRNKTYDMMRESIKEDAAILEDQHPDLFTTAIRKNQREGKIFLDYLRTSYAQTSVCPYSLRANENAGIAMRLKWNDLKNLKSADAYSLMDFQ